MSIDGNPAEIEYVVSTDDVWATTSARIRVNGPVSRTIDIEHRADGWWVNGTERTDLARCLDVDLGWTPATNVLPLRRHPLVAGQSMTTNAAWLRFPELDVVSSEQYYTRVAADRMRYESGEFSAELTVTDDDIVTTYGDDLWFAERIDRI